jgi:hypothetical protein
VYFVVVSVLRLAGVGGICGGVGVTHILCVGLQSLFALCVGCVCCEVGFGAPKAANYISNDMKVASC